MHKNVQAKVIDEIRQVLGDSTETPIDFEKVNKLNYLEMVINETIRLLPVVPFVFRSVEKEIDVVGYTLPENSYLFIPIFEIQRNKKYWGEDADKFRPERFEKEEFKKVHPYAFLPFTSE